MSSTLNDSLEREDLCEKVKNDLSGAFKAMHTGGFTQWIESRVASDVLVRVMGMGTSGLPLEKSFQGREGYLLYYNKILSDIWGPSASLSWSPLDFRTHNNEVAFKADEKVNDNPSTQRYHVFRYNDEGLISYMNCRGRIGDDLSGFFNIVPQEFPVTSPAPPEFLPVPAEFGWMDTGLMCSSSISIAPCLVRSTTGSDGDTNSSMSSSYAPVTSEDAPQTPVQTPEILGERRQFSGNGDTPSPYPTPTLEKPCEHNDWDSVRIKRQWCLLRCRVCGAQWRLPASQISDSRCVPFITSGCRRESCGNLHIHLRKQKQGC